MQLIKQAFFSVSCFMAVASFIGCGKESTSTQNQMGSEVKTVDSLQGSTSSSTEKVVNLYTWADYFKPEVLDAFTKTTGIKVQVDTYDSNETLQGKLMAGATGYDVIVPSDYMVAIMAKSNLIQDLDHTKLPNIVNIEDQFKNMNFDVGNKYSVPFQWGTSGIGYLSDKLKTPPDSWTFLLKPPLELKGKISMLKDMREDFAIALKQQGHSVNTTDEKILEASKAILKEQSSFVKVYNSENYKDLLSQGEVYASHGWSQPIMQAKYTSNDKIEYVIPKEGAILWVDNLSITKKAPHLENAYAFLNYFMDGKVAAEITNTTYGATANKAAKPFIKPELLNNPSIYPPPEVFSKLELTQDVGAATRVYDRLWTELRSE